MRSLVENLCDRLERLLPGRVPNLQLHFIAQVVNGDQALAELYSNCHVALGIETLLGEL